MARISFSNIVTAGVLCVSSLASCGGEGGHPPPVGDAGAGNPTPVIVEFGGTSNAGSGGSTSGPSGPSGGSQAFAGSSEPGDTANGAASFGGTESFGGSAGNTSTGGSFDFGGNGSFGGTFPSAGTFSTGGL